MSLNLNIMIAITKAGTHIGDGNRIHTDWGRNNILGHHRRRMTT